MVAPTGYGCHDQSGSGCDRLMLHWVMCHTNLKRGASRPVPLLKDIGLRLRWSVLYIAAPLRRNCCGVSDQHCSCSLPHSVLSCDSVIETVLVDVLHLP